MALTVETGAIVTGANSYVDAAYVRSHLAAMGIDVSADDAIVEAAILKAMIMIESQQYLGSLVSTSQPLSFPRSGISLHDGRSVASTEIPERLKRALSWVLYYEDQGFDVSAPRESAVVVEKVGPIEVEYTKNSNRQVDRYSILDFPYVKTELGPLLLSGSGVGGGVLLRA